MKGARLRARADNLNRATAGEEEPEDSESDDDELEEDLGFISPLENIDPYVTFKHALQGLCIVFSLES